jgi:diguanylate cyclase (GGDEF)-like protein
MVLYGAVTVAVDVAGRTPWPRVAFNAGQYVLSIGAAALALGVASGGADPGVVAGSVPAIVLAGLVLFSVNHVLAGVGAAILTARPVRPYVLADLGFHGWTAGFQLALAPVLVACAEDDVLLVPLLFLPVLAIYFGGREAVANQHRALHDDLTELPNRRLFAACLGEAVAEVDARGGECAVLLADLDDFKAVNDSLGHEVGDGLLHGIALRLRAVAPPEAVVARLGGDEFAVLLPGLDAPAGLAVAHRMLEALERPLDVASFSLDVRAGFGVAAYPHHARDAHSLLTHADVALRRAKATRGRCETWGEEDEAGADLDRLALAAELREGIDRGELVLHYQPKLALTAGRPDGVEALVRWQHPTLGLLPPDRFIPLAEQSNLIKPLTRWVLDTALAQCRAWRGDGLDLRVAVNLSTRTLLDRALPQQVREALGTWGLPPGSLQLEVTETRIVADFGRAQQVLHELQAMGVRIAIDDFGTGYSSLAQLQQLPADEIKIDKSFVRDMAANANNAAIVRSTIGLAKNLALDVTAEGVETPDAFEHLVELGCDYAQGYALGRPGPAEAVGREVLRHLHGRRFGRALASGASVAPLRPTG